MREILNNIIFLLSVGTPAYSVMLMPVETTCPENSSRTRNEFQNNETRQGETPEAQPHGAAALPP